MMLYPSVISCCSRFSLCILFSFFIYHDMTMAAITAAEKSEIGILYQTPSISQSNGSSPKSGRRMSNCLDRERKMLIFTLPMHWKKLVMTIWKPMIGKQHITMRIALMPNSISALSVVNILAQ